MGNKFKVDSNTYVNEYTRPGVCSVCGHAAVQPNSSIFTKVTKGGKEFEILTDVRCYEHLPIHIIREREREEFLRKNPGIIFDDLWRS